ncbi:MAG: sulfite exporter TauE/SafE family protein [Candidatus Neomarinimicrobiota bacterium]
MEIYLPIIFFLVALIYSSVGLGGGSSYTAIMAILGVNYLLIPSISLALNLIVTLIGSFHFIRKGHFRLNLILPFLITSIPFSYMAGTLNLPKNIFYSLLLVTLIFIAVRIYILSNMKITYTLRGYRKWIFSIGLGAILGFIAGAVGIGGGIYLVPLIIIFRLGSEKEAAASGTIFIFLNSIAGLSARLQEGLFDINMILPLGAAVIIGGFTGSWLGSSRFDPGTIQRIMGLVIMIAIVFLSQKLFFQ